MKSTVLALTNTLLLAILPATIIAQGDPSIIIGKYYPDANPGDVSYAVWPSQSDPCAAGSVTLVTPYLCGPTFSAGSNPNFTNIVAGNCNDFFGYDQLTITPSQAGASPPQDCVTLGKRNTTCSGTGVIYETGGLCGGRLTDEGNAGKRSLADCGGLRCEDFSRQCLRRCLERYGTCAVCTPDGQTDVKACAEASCGYRSYDAEPYLDFYYYNICADGGYQDYSTSPSTFVVIPRPDCAE